jgi:hypothetical protein
MVYSSKNKVRNILDGGTKPPSVPNTFFASSYVLKFAFAVSK